MNFNFTLSMKCFLFKLKNSVNNKKYFFPVSKMTSNGKNVTLHTVPLRKPLQLLHLTGRNCENVQL